ncbi:hypothetical protein [Arthrobacter sp. efr-133-TYG-120]|uniref:hypothetical protein n=1 Tax=Arthrobacter sp. efr-133-TYG-120 TaxID=3040280 RepID=UPI002550E1CA|nr:hypothetical protein [Arthrobacter sp. efr-133-TYG-120]
MPMRRVSRGALIVHPGSSLSTSFVLAALRAIHVDRFGTPRAAGSYPGNARGL